MSHSLADTHAHLAEDGLFPRVDEIVERAAAAGIDRILAVGTDLPSSRRCVELADRIPGVFAAVGVHPQLADNFSAGLDELRKLASHPRVVAIGEIGLDYFRDHISPELQKMAFASQLRLAAELGLPVVVHNRDADSDVLAAIRSMSRPKSLVDRSGVLHCFVGSLDFAREAHALGFRISFAGNLTYRKSDLIRQTAAAAPLEWIMVETDSPYLSPEGHRGQTNLPQNVTLVADTLAVTRQVSVDFIAEQTSANARELFHWV